MEKKKIEKVSVRVFKGLSNPGGKEIFHTILIEHSKSDGNALVKYDSVHSELAKQGEALTIRQSLQ